MSPRRRPSLVLVQLLNLMPRSAWPATCVVVMLSLAGIAVADRRGGMSLPVRRVRAVLTVGDPDGESPRSSPGSASPERGPGVLSLQRS